MWRWHFSHCKERVCEEPQLEKTENKEGKSSFRLLYGHESLVGNHPYPEYGNVLAYATNSSPTLSFSYDSIICHFIIGEVESYSSMGCLVDKGREKSSPTFSDVERRHPEFKRKGQETFSSLILNTSHRPLNFGARSLAL